jgi:hypothetical protein
MSSESESESEIVLMFLGGPPVDGAVFEHWKKMIEKCTYKEKFYIVTHPMDLTTRTMCTMKAICRGLGFDNDRFFVVDDDHHVGTKWATRSLVDATLLMMQYATIKLKHFAKKYVLLSNTCCPLFSLDIIYQQLTADHKSWLHGGDKGFPREFQPFILESMGGLFNMNHMNYFSQWMALDRRHAKYFFYDTPDNTFIRTYNVERNVQPNDQPNNKKSYTCFEGNINKIIVIPVSDQGVQPVSNQGVQQVIENTEANKKKYKELTKLLNSFLGGNTINEIFNNTVTPPTINKNPCAPTDEHFFGSFILYKIFEKIEKNEKNEKKGIDLNVFNNIIKDNLKYNTNNLEYITRLNIYKGMYLEELKAIYTKYMEEKKYIFMPSKLEGGLLTENYIIWTGPQFKLNTEKISDYKYLYCDHDAKLNEFKSDNNNNNNNNINNITTHIIDENDSKLKECIEKEENKCNPGSFYSKHCRITGETTQDEINPEIFLSSCTYTDWNGYAIDPENMLRSFKITPELLGTNTQNLLWYTFNINEFLNTDNPIKAYKILFDNDKNLVENGIKRVVFRSLQVDKLIKMPNYHPIEYSRWSERSMINAFILFSYMKKTFSDNPSTWYANIFKWAHDKYRNILVDIHRNNIQNFIRIERVDTDTTSNNANNANNDSESKDSENIEFLDFFQGMVNTNKNDIYGTFLTPDILLSALCTNSLFIRKCKPGCLIDIYTDFMTDSLKMIYGDIKLTDSRKIKFDSRPSIKGRSGSTSVIEADHKKKSDEIHNLINEYNVVNIHTIGGGSYSKYIYNKTLYRRLT